jgi:type II secretory pathway pseudopilin PulG
MKNKGFTFIEIIVATTLLIMLTSMAETTAYNLIQAVTKLKARYLNLKQNIAVLYTDLALAKMNYATDLAIELAATPTPTPTPTLGQPTPTPTPTPTPEAVPITDLDSLLRAYLLTNDGATTGNIVATITVGTMLDVQNQIRPTLPIIDWRGGTLQEIVFPSNLASP